MSPGLRRAGRVAGGGALVVAGLVMLVLPGPGLPLVAAGLLVLGPEFPWARRARQRLLRLAASLERVVARRGGGAGVRGGGAGPRGGRAGERGGGPERRRALDPGAAAHG